MKLFTQYEHDDDDDDDADPTSMASSDCCARCILLSNDSYNDGSFNICLN